jgi:IclR family pca regulon transcriptional regulator
MNSEPISKEHPETAALRHGDPNYMTTLARGLTVIQAFSETNGGITMARLCRQTGLSRACVRRCLYTLEKLGFASDSENGRFYLRPRILTLGYSYISSMPLSAVAQPVLTRLSDLLHESCSIALLDSAEVIYIARASVTRILSIGLQVGSRLPAFCTSMGRILLAFSPPEDLEKYLINVELQKFTSKTVSSPSKLRQILRVVKQNGYCIVDQELELGLRSMAAPIWSPTGRVVAALNVGAHAQRVSIQDLRTQFLPALLSSAKELSMLLR